MIATTNSLSTTITGIEVSGKWLYVKHSVITSETSTEEIQVMSVMGECPAGWFSRGAEIMRRIKDALHNEYKDEKKMLEIQNAIKAMKEYHGFVQAENIFFDEPRD